MDLASNDTHNARPLPDGWMWTTLGEITEPSKEKVNPQGIQRMPYIGLEHVEKDTGKLLGLGYSDEVRSTKAVFRRGDLLYGKLRPYLNKVHVADFDGICSTDILVFPKNSYISNKYLLYRLLSGDFVRYANLNVSGVQHPRVNFKILSQFPIALAPLPEQHRIVAEIETQFTRLDAAVAALERAQATLQRYKASVLKAACEGRLLPPEEVRALRESPDYEPADVLLQRILAERRKRWEAEQWQKEIEKAKKKAAQAKRKAAGLPARISDLTDREWQNLPETGYANYLPKDDEWKHKYTEPKPPNTESLPELPEEWVWTSLDQCFRVERGRFSVRPRNDPRYYNGPYPFVQIGDLPRDGGSITGFSQTLNADGLQVSKMFSTGTVLIAIVGATIANTGILTFDSCCPDSLVAIQAPEKIRLQYAEFYLRSKKLEIRQTSYASGGQPNINLGTLHPYPISLPLLAEQHCIVEEVERRLSVVAALEAAVEANLRRAERLRQAILKRAFEGRLVPQDPNDEPASVLLARIQAEKAQREAPKTSKKTSRKKQRPRQLKLI